ncbi:UMP kinase [bacterium]|nr:UMP kinase [bacterium]
MVSSCYQRVMLKITGESLLGEREYGIDPAAARNLAQKIKAVWQQHIQVAVVIGGGNIFRGIAGSKNGIDRATADYMGMLATVMNGMALEDALIKAEVPVRLQSALTMTSVAEPFLRKRAIHHLEKGRVVILSAGTGNPYVTTDTGASLHALELHCDVLMKATKVDGVYDADPTTHPQARRYQTLSYRDIVTQHLDIMDQAALSMSMDNDLTTQVFELFAGDNLLRAVSGEPIGTVISNHVETKFADEPSKK